MPGNLTAARAETDQTLGETIAPLPVECVPSDEVVVPVDHPAQARFQRGGVRVQVLTPQRVAHLQPQRVASAQTARDCPGVDQRRPQAFGPVHPHCQLSAALARVSRPAGPDGVAGPGGFE